MNLDLRQLYNILDYSYQQRDRPVGESVCIVIVPPRDVAEQFNGAGKKDEDNSPAHCTVAYIGDVDPTLEQKIHSVAESICQNVRPFNVRLGRMDIFENPEHDVYHMQVQGVKLHRFREALKHGLAQNQITIDVKHPVFKPHITMEYAEPGQDPQHITQKPQGKWRVENAWLWGLSEPYLLQFK